MKTLKTFLIVVVGFVIIIYFFNHQGAKKKIPLEEIFPEEDLAPVEIEYEFVEEKKESPTASVVVTPAPKVSAPVVVQQEKASPPPAVIDTSKHYSVQIASFKDRAKAESALGRIKTIVPAAYIKQMTVKGKGVWFRVYGGRYATKAEAQQGLTQIKESYPNSFVIKIAN